MTRQEILTLACTYAMLQRLTPPPPSGLILYAGILSAIFTCMYVYMLVKGKR